MAVWGEKFGAALRSWTLIVRSRWSACSRSRGELMERVPLDGLMLNQSCV